MKHTAVPLSPSAARMRRRRERQKCGSVFVRLEMTRAAVDRLIELRFLTPESRRDSIAVAQALIKFGTAVLWPDLSM